jgi:glucan 1,3-beta-glucosidase
MDSIFWNVGEVIRINTADKLRPAITIDNIRCFMSPRVVQEWGGETLLNSEAGANIAQWSLGWQFTDNMKTGSMVYGANSQLPTKPKSLAPDGLGYFFEREKPQYDGYAKSEFLSVLDFGVRNDGTSGDINTGAINAALQAASAQNKTLVFPAGIYLVDDTINIPARCRMVGVLWSQIMATGPAFSDPSKPKVLAR